MYNALNTDEYTEILFYGASRAGKTFLVLYWFVVQCLIFKANCLVVRNTFTSLQSGMIAQTMPAVMGAIAKSFGKSNYRRMTVKNVPFCKFNGESKTLEFYNGAYIQFASMRGNAAGDNSFDKILSTEWGHIFVDEVSEIDQKAIDTLRSRLSQKVTILNKLVFALNPTTKLHWTYKRFFMHKGMNGEPLPKNVTNTFLVMHFNTTDNAEYVAKGYMNTLNNMSRLQQLRFKDGEYADEYEGEVFKNITWGNRPKVEDIQDCVMYTDPSAKDQKTNDFKATVLLVMAKNKIYLWDVRAVQGTSRQMLENMYELYISSPVAPRIYMERKQIPLGFDDVLEEFQASHGWVIPINWDTANHGDKFTCIESSLEPLFAQGKFIFCHQIKDSGVYEQTIDQFLRFSRNNDKNKKDDIPDACAKGYTYLNHNTMLNTIGRDEVMFYHRGTATRMS
ncbi:MAG: phage terminase large subunit [Oscillospiraceae bacterium]